jgi:TP901 family phage tail tape measure protein
MNDARSSLADMKGALGEINKNQEMNRLAADMAMMTGMTDPMRKALSEAMDQPSRIAGSLDSAFRNIQVASGNTNEEMAVLRQELLSIGGRAVAGPQAVAGAFADIAGGVDDASKRMAIMNASVTLAEANQADLGMATNAMINVMNSWGLAAEDESIAADIFFQAADMGAGDLDEFAGAISHISALAAGAGIGLDELGTSMAYASTKGMSAAQSQKQLKGIISTLTSPSENLADLYGALGIESGKAMLQEYGLAESLAILKDALGGNEQAFADIVGSAEAATFALALTEDQYVDFAQTFAEGMGTVSAAARSVQLESIEMKMARLDAASQSLQARIGGDINGIKGFFIDMKFGFLSSVVSPIMSSPVGGAVSKIAAVVGLGAKGFLDMGSGALNAATQITTLAANISNAGGFVKLFSSTLGFMKSGFGLLLSPLKAVGTSVIGFIANLFGIGGASAGAAAGTGTFGAASAGAAGGIGVATGATTSFAASLWAATWPVLAVVAGIALVAGGVYLLVKNWSKVSGFFVGLWEKITGAFSAAWNWIKNLIFGTSDWILGAIAIFMPIVGIPALIIKHWDAIKTFFLNLWNDPKAAITGFIDWIGGKVEAFIAPFKAVGDFVGGTFSKIGGFFKGLVGGGEESGKQLNDAFAGGIQSGASAPAEAFGGSLQGVARQMPHSDAPEGPLSELTSSGRALTDTFASGMDEAALREKASLAFSAAIPQGETALEFPSRGEAAPQGAGSHTIHVQNLYLQADDCQSLLDFVRMVMQAVHRPEEAPV